MKLAVRKEYFSRIKSIFNSKINRGNTVKAINTYNGGIVDWTKENIEYIDRKTMKLMTINKALHQRGCVARLYIPRELGGKGMQRIESCINIERRTLGQYLKNTIKRSG